MSAIYVYHIEQGTFLKTNTMITNFLHVRLTILQSFHFNFF
jgi:hypothetical protein